MSLSYTLKESFSGFTRTKLSTVISILTIGVSLLLLGVFAVISINTTRLIEELKAKVVLEVFLQEPVSRAQISQLAARVRAIEGVDSLIVITKEQAAEIFRKEFGEDIRSVLEFNPLPPSFKVFLRPDHQTSAGVRKVEEQIVRLSGIDEVIYRRELVELLDRRTAAINNVTLGLGILISISAILFVSNTIRLAIYAKRKIIRTMELVGATWTFIRLPFLIEGVIQGLVGGILAAAMLYGLLSFSARLLVHEFASYLVMPTSFYLLVIAAGAALGLIGAVISIIRFMRAAES
ncbi:MAG TPA: permease-like cell division protein FtsX [Bacteroidota bacterium]|nr:permease-like cell division protein FtsX [Bacteroidota bacterium]